MSTPLLDLLASRRPARKLGTVVVVGAGNGDMLAAWRRFGAERLILVEGDPESAQALRERAAGLPGVEVAERVLAAVAQVTTWHQFSVGTFNGPVTWAAVKASYPGLRQVGTLEVTSQDVASLMAELAIQHHDGRADCLVFDVPGQEAALLEALPPSELEAWDTLVLRGCSATPAPADQAVRWLCKHHAHVLASDVASEPLWPVHLLGFDAHALGERTLKLRIESLQAQLRQRVEELGAAKVSLDTIRAERDRARVLAEGHQQELVQLAAGQTSQADALRDVRATLAQRDEEIVRLRAALDEADQRQQILEQELSRAEVQVGLLKDLLLREPEL